MSRKLLNYDAAHTALYRIGTGIGGSFPRLAIEEPAEELMLALLGSLLPTDEQRLRYLVRDLYQYAKTTEWDGAPADLRNFDGYEYHGGFNAKWREAWCIDPGLSAWRKCFKALDPARTAQVADAVACVAQDVVRIFIHTFDTEFGLAMWNFQMAAIRRNSEELAQLKDADRKLFVYPQLKELLLKRGFRVR